MRILFKSNFFWTKMAPTVFICLFIAGSLYPLSIDRISGIIVGVSLISILMVNLFLKQNWINWFRICLY